jgi:hypothetical protein
MSNISKVLAPLFAALVLVSINPVMAEGTKSWNDLEVLSISDELSKAAQELRVECRNSPPKYFEETSGQHLKFRYHVRHFRSVALELNDALEDGRGKDGTSPMYETLAGMRKDLTGYAETPGGPWLAVQQAVAEVDKQLTRLDPYYSRN